VERGRGQKKGSWRKRGQLKEEIKVVKFDNMTKQTSNKHQNDICQMNEVLSMRETDHKNTIVHR
jgi:hypothetical protein